jgi:intracellular septation protein A
MREGWQVPQTPTNDATSQRHEQRGYWFLKAILPIVFDVAVPLAVYYGLHAAGASNTVALLAGGGLPAIRAVYGLARHQRVDTLTVFMIILFVAGGLLTFISGNPRFLVAKESIGTGAGGLWIIWSAFSARPLTYSTTRPFVTRGEKAAMAVWDRLADRPGKFRRILRGLALMWGIGLVIDCGLRLIVAFTMPVSTAVGFSAVILVSVIVVLGLVSTVAGGVMRVVLDAELAADARTASGPAPEGAVNQAGSSGPRGA